MVNSQIWMALSDWELNAEIDGEHADRIQSAFDFSAQKSLIYKGKLTRASLYCAQRAVARDPLDLNAHVKRFYLAMICRSKDAVIGALIDMMIILRFRGDSLSLRLINEAEALIGHALSSELRDIVVSQSTSRLVNLDTSHSVLINGNSMPAVFKKKGAQ